MPKVSAQHSLQRRSQILEAALRCFANEGFHATSMNDVIRESGLSAGAVYHYFSSKTALISAAVEVVLERAENALQPVLTATPPPPPSAAVEALLEHVLLQRDETDVDLSRVGVAAWAEAQRDPEVMHIARRVYRVLREDMRLVLQRWSDAGNLPADADLDAGARAMFGSLPGFMVQRLVLGDVTPQQYARGLEMLGRREA